MVFDTSKIIKKIIFFYKTKIANIVDTSTSKSFQKIVKFEFIFDQFWEFQIKKNFFLVSLIKFY